MKIATLLMVKNESKRILTTLNSLKNKITFLIVLDTGSEDNTIELIKKYCDENNIKLFLKETIFKNFEETRNELINFADTFNFDYYLLMDCNDELKNDIPDILDKDAYLIRQEWFSGIITSYWNIRMIKANIGWKYKGKVHEYLINNNNNNIEKLKNFYLFQDRTQDDDKTYYRFNNDKIILLEEYEKDSNDPRTVFYLAQTFMCLGEKDNAEKYFKIRSNMLNGFYEERFHSFLILGTLTDNISYYLLSLSICIRVEPLIKISEYYRKQKNWNLSYLYCKIACELKYPEECKLFVNKNDYDYYRWHLLGIVSYYCNQMEDGVLGCKKAIENKNLEIDKYNLKFYF